MKKTLFIASFMMISMVAYAQQEVGTLSFQPKVGLNIARYTDAEETTPRFGVASGAEMEYQMTKKFSMAVGLLYSMQGIRTDAETFYGSGKVTFKTDYINIPIIANVYLLKGLALKFGLQPGFNINAKYYVTSGGYWSDSSSLTNIGVKVKTFDLAIPVGLSYETKYLVLDARYNVGVTKVFDNEGADSRNCVFQFTIGHKFRL